MLMMYSTAVCLIKIHFGIVFYLLVHFEQLHDTTKNYCVYPHFYCLAVKSRTLKQQQLQGEWLKGISSLQ